MPSRKNATIAFNSVAATSQLCFMLIKRKIEFRFFAVAVFFFVVVFLSRGNADRSENNTNTLTTQHFTRLRPTEKSSMRRRARLPPSNPALPTTDGRLSHNATRSQMPTEEVTNTLQVSVPLRPPCVCVCVCPCILCVCACILCVCAGDKEHLSCRERKKCNW